MNLPRSRARRHARPRPRMEPLESRQLLAVIGNNIGVGDQLQNYRIAIAATAEYTAYHGGVNQAYQAINDFVDDLNELYERELSIHLGLVSGTNIVFSDPDSDPFTNGDPVALLNENQGVIDSNIGNNNYDIGHVFGTLNGGGSGIASLGVVGRTGVKARGSSSFSSPTGQGFLVLAAHEIAHQFGASHTFNGVTGNCSSGNRSSSNAYEPGSGTTLQSYGGICGSDNVFNGKDVYFHSNSFEQIQEYIDRNNATRPDSLTPTGNNIPTVDGGSDYSIPARTAFELTATGSDADANQTLLYNWEQLDLGPAIALDSGDNGSSPLFRSYPADADPTRTFPRSENLLVGTIPRGELLPTTTRELNFRVTVRDGEGGVNSDDVLLNVIDTGAAFTVTSPNTGVTWTGGVDHTVTWNVAGTNGSDIDAANVDIFLSTDGGQAFPLLLATTANTGSATVTVPNIDTNQARLRVQGSGNIFFDISDTNFSIVANSNATGVTLTESGGSTFVEEGGAIDTYQIALNTQPTAAVTIEITADADTEISLDGINFATTQVVSLASTSPRTVTVRAVDDDLDEGSEISFVQHAIIQTGDPSYPVSLPVDQISATVVDSELPPVIGLDFDCCQRDAPQDWSQTTFYTDQNNLIRDDGLATSIDLDFSAFGTFNASTLGPSAGTIPRHAISLSDISGYTVSTGSVSATYSSLTPGREYGVYVFGFEQRNGTYIQNVSIDGATTLPTFTQSLVSGSLQVNDELGDSSRNLASFEQVVAADANGRITIRITPTNNSAGVGLAGLAIREIPLAPVIPTASVVDRHLFYNNSAFDGNSPGFTANDNAAIATDKKALEPGTPATFDNYTSYVAGINGIMIDVDGLANPTGVDASDFTFRVGQTNSPDNWRVAPAPSSVTVTEGGGANGSDRITLIWNDGAITNTWLEVTATAGGDLGLVTADVFYFGNVIAETGNSLSNADVDGTDFNGVRANPRNFLNPAAITDAFDINRDGRVNTVDLLLVRDNTTSSASVVPLIVPQGGANLTKSASTVVESVKSDDVSIDPTDEASAEETIFTIDEPRQESREEQRSHQRFDIRGILMELHRIRKQSRTADRPIELREQILDRFWAEFGIGQR